MTGIEKAAIAVARDIWDTSKEDRMHLKDIMTGKIPANDMYTVRLVDTVHQAIIAANRLHLELILAPYRRQA